MQIGTIAKKIGLSVDSSPTLRFAINTPRLLLKGSLHSGRGPIGSRR